MQLLIWQMLFLPSLSICLLSAAKASNTQPLSYLRGISTLQPYIIIYSDHLFLPQDITVVHYIDDIMMIGSSEQELATTLDTLVRHLHVKGWEINPKKIWKPSISVKLLGVPWWGLCQDIPSKVKNNLFPLTPLTSKKEAQHLVGPFGFWRQHISMILRLIYWATQKLLVWERAQNQRRLCNRFRLLCKLCCHLSYRIQQIQWCLKYQWQRGYLGRPL